MQGQTERERQTDREREFKFLIFTFKRFNKIGRESEREHSLLDKKLSKFPKNISKVYDRCLKYF